MDEKQGFLRRILENPADDNVRLVYADWLEEHAGNVECPDCGGVGVRGGFFGDNISTPVDYYEEDCKGCNGTGTRSNGNMERALLIRCQIESGQAAARVAAVTAKTQDQVIRKDWPELDALMKEEGRIFAITRHIWAMDLPPDLRKFVADGSFHHYYLRGMVEEVQTTWALWDRWGDEITWCWPSCIGCGGRGTTQGAGPDRGNPECGRCKGKGKNPPTVKCPEKIDPKKGVYTSVRRDTDYSPQLQHKDCVVCRGRAVVDRPLPEFVHPIRVVRLVGDTPIRSNPPPAGRYYSRSEFMAYLIQRWPGTAFTV